MKILRKLRRRAREARIRAEEERRELEEKPTDPAELAEWHKRREGVEK